ncbi:MAG: hypothetical protein Q7R45_00475, partial [Sulfuricaulis sp.]|nr:hypothetical protein [Sulfuricaulis sp.]
MGLKSKIILNSLLGGAGGFMGWALTEYLLRGFYRVPWDQHAWHETVIANAKIGVLTGLLIGGALGIADALWSRSPARFRRTVILAAIAGAIGGFVGLAIGQSAFNSFTPESGRHNAVSFALLVIGHAVGWGLFGAALGAAQGLVGPSAVRAKHGAIGGLIGGFIGGMTFAVTPYLLVGGNDNYGGTSRMVSLTLTGFTIGLMIGLAQDLLKQAWVVVLKGNNEGREIPIYKP